MGKAILKLFQIHYWNKQKSKCVDVDRSRVSHCGSKCAMRIGKKEICEDRLEFTAYVKIHDF